MFRVISEKLKKPNGRFLTATKKKEVSRTLLPGLLQRSAFLCLKKPQLDSWPARLGMRIVAVDRCVIHRSSFERCITPLCATYV